jgi:hypothetical protein
MKEDNSETVNNLIDFVAYRLEWQAKQYAARGNDELSLALYDVLDMYQRGLYDVEFTGGMPVVAYVDSGSIGT